LPYGIEGPADAGVLVLVNSIGMRMSLWEEQLPAFTACHRVLRYDQRGHGDAPTPPGPYTIDDLGADLVALLDRLEIERASVCGLSLGGLVATWVAAHHPERVDRLVLACTTAHPGNPEKWRGRAAQGRRDGVAEVVKQSSLGWFTPIFAQSHPGVVARLQAVVASNPDEGYAGCAEALATADLRAVLGRVSAPTLVIAGQYDRGFPIEHARRLRDGIAGARLVQLDNVAHIANVEAPAAFNAAVLAHLEADQEDRGER
jgi:3-oxoadipate enol-lactonase